MGHSAPQIVAHRHAQGVSEKISEGDDEQGEIAGDVSSKIVRSAYCIFEAALAATTANVVVTVGIQRGNTHRVRGAHFHRVRQRRQLGCIHLLV